MFQDVDVKFQVHLCLKSDVDVFENAFFLWIITNIETVLFLEVMKFQIMLFLKSLTRETF